MKQRLIFLDRKRGTSFPCRVSLFQKIKLSQHTKHIFQQHQQTYLCGTPCGTPSLSAPDNTIMWEQNAGYTHLYMYFFNSWDDLHALVHCLCHPLCYHVSKYIVSIAEMIRDSKWKPEFLVFLGYQEHQECRVGQVGLEDIAMGEIVRNFVLMK